MLILGLSSSFKNDTAAALVRDGAIESALENYKLQPTVPRGMPEAAIRYCLSKGGVTWSDIDVVAAACDPFSGLGASCLLPTSPVAFRSGSHKLPTRKGTELLCQGVD